MDRAREALRAAREAVADAERALGAVEGEGAVREPERPQEPAGPSWLEKLWLAPSECRIGVQELSEALAVSPSWIYSRTKESADPRLPHSKLGGSLVFKCGEIRGFVRDHEQVAVAYRSDAAPGEMRVRRTA